MRRAIRVGAAFSAATLAALLLLVAAPASAHNYLVDSTPLEGEILTVLPEEFSVTTNDVLLDLAGDGGGFAIQILDAAGGYYGDGCVSIRDESLSTLAALGEPGEYRMLWQLVSADGHTISDEINFTWQPDADQVLSEALDAPPACGGGFLEESAPPAATEGSEGDSGSDSSESGTSLDAESVVLIGGAVALVLVAAVAIFLISVKRKRDES
ncbi:copper resistance protein CopC [Salinibacterium sp. SWN139]|uniref:copper resistance CopC family protein n=1 Tax=Salinibacterium sp. SWN139 TaxID=2792055 RepID=UPI0018CDCD1D|nr:copper resistance CopC family protein [Salinibacterium sp. SWN139]MBH0053899.1 copper resistance protein CopC [Salinibacterium sp. SWN139]